MLPLLNQCCCGCSLQTGAILIGAYQMVRGLYEVITDAFLGYSLKLQRRHEYGWQSVWEGFPIAMLVLGILKIIAAFLLLFGANKERDRLVFWWLIVSSALTIIDAVCFPFNMVDFFKYSDTVEAVLTLIFALADLVLLVYFLWVVYSYYRIIEERRPGTMQQQTV